MTETSQDNSPLPISDQLIRATARIECINGSGEVSCGTGFFFRVELDGGLGAPLLVTNRHVVKEQLSAVLQLTVRNKDNPGSVRTVLPFGLQGLQSFVVYHPSQDVDLAAIAFGPVEQKLGENGLVAEYVTLSRRDIVTDATVQECRALEDLLMIGYPNGIWDSRNNRPILRRASSATPIYENYNLEPKFLIDCACFPGSSGSPVFLFNEGVLSTRKGSILGSSRVALVGVLYAGFLHLAKGRVVEATVTSMQSLQAQMTVPNSIGICVKAAQIGGLIEEVKTRVAQQAAA